LGNFSVRVHGATDGMNIDTNLSYSMTSELQSMEG
jgi:hypothetical protein